MIKEIRYKVIPHSEQRYNTVGDYWEIEPGVWEIRVSDTGDWREALAIFLHETVELGLTQHRGIDEPRIKAFDEKFEDDPSKPFDAEPGDDPMAPYRDEHRFAENIERLLIQEFGIHWNDYDHHVMSVWNERH